MNETKERCSAAPELTSNGRVVIRPEARPPSIAGLDLTKVVPKKEYRRRLRRLQHRLKEAALAYLLQERRAVIVFEGSDAAGKGGAIRRISWPLDPRGLKVWPIAAPTPEEKGHHYLYRFWKRLPDAGQIVIFDRSWYGRVLVERIEGFATVAEWRRAYDEINEFERMLYDDGVRIVKIYLHITKEEQLDRFRARYHDPLKRWKLSEEDLRNRARWSAYEGAIEEMFRKTSTETSPWTLIPSNDKRYSRLASMDAVLRGLSEGLELRLPGFGPEFDAALREALSIEG